MLDNQITRDLENMDEVMERTAVRTDIWQDRYIYWIAKAIRDILVWIVRKGWQKND
jgi:hypothetical protein